MSESNCWVTVPDYYAHFGGRGEKRAPVPAVWSGEDRRTGPRDRRTPDHERRWNTEKGRRYRLGDRRRS